MFTGNGCGSCHVFAAAGSKGKVGPSLDARRLTAAQVRAVVQTGGAGMPGYKDRIKGRDLERLVTFVATRSRAR